MRATTSEPLTRPDPQTPLPATSLTICSRNRPQLLLETVESVLQGDEVPTEIVIVDQSDAPHALLSSWRPERACEIHYVRSQTVGVARARNVAIATAAHDILVVTDDDMLAPASWYGSLVRALLAAGPGNVVTGRVLPLTEGRQGGFAPSTIADMVPAIYEGRVGKDVLYTNNMAMYRSAVVHIGVFDERLGAGGRFPAAYDNDFGFRLLEAGYRILYVPEAMIYHRAWRSGADYSRLCWNYGRGQGAFYAKHLSLRDSYMLRRMLASIGRRSMFAVLHLLRRRHQQAYGEFRFVLGLASGASGWLLTEDGRRR